MHAKEWNRGLVVCFCFASVPTPAKVMFGVIACAGSSLHRERGTELLCMVLNTAFGILTVNLLELADVEHVFVPSSNGEEVFFIDIDAWCVEVHKHGE